MKSFKESASNNDIISLEVELPKINNDELNKLISDYLNDGNSDTLHDIYMVLDDLFPDNNKYVYNLYSLIKNKKS